ncbi:MAG: type II secretion system protein [Verrucomicrobiales bacterium]|nr:type II secretion system protein [Verrucomicrobiales bacterium]
MKLNNFKKQAGLTLIEVTLVIAVLLGLISVLFIGVGAYKEGSDRAKCILNITNAQKAVRSYQNMYEIAEGASITQGTIFGAGKMVETLPSCPSSGTYTFSSTVPAVGTAYLTCDFGSGDTAHAPTGGTAGW